MRPSPPVTWPAIAAGAAAHSDHGRDLAFTLHAVATGEAQGYEIRDEAKLFAVAAKHGIETKGLNNQEIALAIANKAISEFGQQRGEFQLSLHRAGQTPENLAR